MRLCVDLAGRPEPAYFSQVRMALTLLYEFGEQLAAKMAEARQQQRRSLAQLKSALLSANEAAATPTAHESRAGFDRLLGRLVARAATLNVV